MKNTDNEKAGDVLLADTSPANQVFIFHLRYLLHVRYLFATYVAKHSALQELLQLSGP